MLQAAKCVSRREPETGDFPLAPAEEGAHVKRKPQGESRVEDFDLGLNTFLTDSKSLISLNSQENILV